MRLAERVSSRCWKNLCRNTDREYRHWPDIVGFWHAPFYNFIGNCFLGNYEMLRMVRIAAIMNGIVEMILFEDCICIRSDIGGRIE